MTARSRWSRCELGTVWSCQAEWVIERFRNDLVLTVVAYVPISRVDVLRGLRSDTDAVGSVQVCLWVTPQKMIEVPMRITIIDLPSIWGQDCKVRFEAFLTPKWATEFDDA
jgi:hypothetical protein